MHVSPRAQKKIQEMKCEMRRCESAIPMARCSAACVFGSPHGAWICYRSLRTVGRSSGRVAVLYERPLAPPRPAGLSVRLSVSPLVVNDLGVVPPARINMLCLPRLYYTPDPITAVNGASLAHCERSQHGCSLLPAAP